MATEKAISLSINGLSMSWDDSPRCIPKPCKKCGKSTTGRSTNDGGIKTPACMTCSIDLLMEKTLAIFKR